MRQITFFICRAFLAVALLPLAIAARAQGAYPAHPIQLIVPFPAGSVTDAQTRAIAQEVGKKLGQEIVILNKPGATGTLGPSTMAKTAQPDGYTLSVVPSSLVGLPHMQRVQYDPLKDFTYIIGLTGYSFGLVVKKNSPIKNLDDYIAYAKEHPGELTYASSGIGGGTHLAMSQFERCQGIKLNHITFKGGADATVALLGGHVASQADGAWGPLVDAGNARLLLMLTPYKLPQFADVPTLQTLCPDVSVDSQVIGIAGPHGMDPKVVQKIHDAFKESMNTELFVQALAASKQAPIYLSSKDYAAYIEKTFNDKRALVKSMGLLIE